MDKHRLLVKTLLERTKNGLIAWKETGEDGTYQVSFANSSLLIREAQPNNVDILLDIVNDQGIPVDSFSGASLDWDGAGQYTEIMLDLYQLAKRIALGSERILDGILAELTQGSRYNVR